MKRFDQERGWDRVLPTATCAHLAEEVGEVCRAVLRLSGYKPAAERDGRQELAEELADATTFLVKLAYTFDIDLEETLADNRRKCERRYVDPQQGREEAARYLQTTQAWLDQQAEGAERAPSPPGTNGGAGL